MNPAQIEGAVRSLIIAIGALAGGLGYAAGVDWVAVASAVVTVGGFAWSLWSNRTTNLVAQVVKDPAVIQVVASPAIAAAIPSSKVRPLT